MAYANLNHRDASGYPVRFRSAKDASLSGNGRNNENTKLLLPLSADFSDTAAGSIAIPVVVSEGLAIAPDAGKFGGGAARFNGVNTEFIRIDCPTATLTSGDFRLSFWFKGDAVQLSEPYVFNSMTGFGAADVYLDLFFLGTTCYIGIAPSQYANPSMPLNAWNYVSYAYISGAWYIHVNGTRVTNGVSAALSASDSFIFGAPRYNGNLKNVFAGYLSEVILERGDLSAFSGPAIPVPEEPASA